MDNKEFHSLIKQKRDYKKAREAKYKDDSKTRLGAIMKKKIETTMIGALSSFEKHFKFLWENENGSELTEDQQYMKTLYTECRSEILDKGNAQIRNVDAELNQYEMEWKRYTMKIPMKPRPLYNNEEGNK